MNRVNNVGNKRRQLSEAINRSDQMASINRGKKWRQLSEEINRAMNESINGNRWLGANSLKSMSVVELGIR